MRLPFAPLAKSAGELSGRLILTSQFAQSLVRLLIIPVIVALLLATMLSVLIAGSAPTFAQQVGSEQTDPTTSRAPEHNTLSLLASEHMIWRRVPLKIHLRVGTERMVTFPAPVRLGVPHEVTPFLRMQIVERTAYLFASEPFPGTRLVAEDPMRGTVILLDVAAEKTLTTSGPVEVHLETKQDNGTQPTASRSADEAENEPDEVDMAMLTRFAARQVYAPRRLLSSAVPGIRAIAFDSAPIPELYRGARLQAVPIGAWRSSSLYVSAVKLTNLSAQPMELDPRELRGNWLAATFQHSRLLRVGDEEDTTVVYLISERRIEESRP
jgi:integrating conjugative element protein (TIGR03749 family)